MENQSNVIEILLRGNKKFYFQCPEDLDISINDMVIFELDRGVELGKVSLAGQLVQLKKPVISTKKIVRKAEQEDIKKDLENRDKEMEAYKICKQKILEHNLAMKLVDVHYQFDRSKITFFFSAEQRIDFRALVKDLANIYRTRIELHQIGVRDEARRLGGLGPCGYPLCCISHIKEFDHITTQMARDQNLAPNPTKLSGNCCRLKCCLKYELEFYQDSMKEMPPLGSSVKTSQGDAEVLGCNIFTRKLHLRKGDGTEINIPVTEAKW
jgi:cell fate regulator YaaT (PSP1 superfamily)